jgi:hypothetical protein
MKKVIGAVLALGVAMLASSSMAAANSCHPTKAEESEAKREAAEIAPLRDAYDKAMRGTDSAAMAAAYAALKPVANRRAAKQVAAADAAMRCTIPDWGRLQEEMVKKVGSSGSSADKAKLDAPVK